MVLNVNDLLKNKNIIKIRKILIIWILIPILLRPIQINKRKLKVMTRNKKNNKSKNI